MSDVIPIIESTLGKDWNRPSLDKILVDDYCAVMEKETFDALLNYSFSLPSSLYSGKMWRQNNYLCYCTENEYSVFINRRGILIV